MSAPSFCQRYALCPFFYEMRLWAIAGIIGAAFYGGLLTLGVLCMSLLSSTGKVELKRRRFLQTYISALLLTNTAFVGVFFIANQVPMIFLSTPLEKQAKLLNTWAIVYSLVPLLSIGLTGGLLVWRCYMVHSALGNRKSYLQALFWVFPMCLWVVTIVTGTIGGAIANTPRLGKLEKALQATALASNILLDFFATSYIIVRLLLHRRIVRACLGDDATAKHLRIVGILLQSAAVNIPVSIVAAVGVANKWIFGTVVVFVVVTCQSFASVLIIHQVAVGRTIGEQQSKFTTRNTMPVSTPASDWNT